MTTTPTTRDVLETLSATLVTAAEAQNAIVEAVARPHQMILDIATSPPIAKDTATTPLAVTELQKAVALAASLGDIRQMDGAIPARGMLQVLHAVLAALSRL